MIYRQFIKIEWVNIWLGGFSVLIVSFKGFIKLRKILVIVFGIQLVSKMMVLQSEILKLIL